MGLIAIIILSDQRLPLQKGVAVDVSVDWTVEASRTNVGTRPPPTKGADRLHFACQTDCLHVPVWRAREGTPICCPGANGGRGCLYKLAPAQGLGESPIAHEMNGQGVSLLQNPECRYQHQHAAIVSAVEN